MAGEEALLGALILDEYAPAGARTVDCYRRIRKIGEGTYGHSFIYNGQSMQALQLLTEALCYSWGKSSTQENKN
ncbi:unnamed protein product [Urochloa humidicola]